MKALAAALAVACLLGCSSEDTQKIGQDARSLAEHTGEAFGKMTETAKVKFVLAQLKSVDMKDVDVSIKDGVATISGRTDSGDNANRILDVVKDVRGVDRVENKITVEKAPRP